MMAQAVERSARYADILSDPLFKRGYADCWSGRELCVQRGWDDAEQLAYVRGRHFAAWLQDQDEEQIALSRGTLANPLAELKLLMAFHEGAVL